MASEAILRIKIIADATSAATGLDQAGKTGGRFASAMQKAALPAAAVGAAVLGLGKKAVDAASKLQQAQGAVEAVFGAHADAVKKASKSAAVTMGLSAADYQQYAALVGTALQNAGMSVGESVAASNKVMQRGADLSALYGGTTAEAVEAINAAVARSEFDPLEKYGASLNMTAVNAELAAKGQDKLTGAALDTAKKQAILRMVFEKTAKAQGQYAREADSVAGRQQTAAAQWENAAATLGQILLPVVAKVVAQLAKLATWAQKNATAVQILVGVIGGLAAAVLVVNAALKAWAAMQAIASLVSFLGGTTAATAIGVYALAAAEWVAAAATSAWAGAMAVLTSPITLVIVAVLALVAAVVILWKKSVTFRTVVLAVWAAIKTGATAVAGVVKRVFMAAFSAVTAYVRAYLAAVRVVFAALRAAVSAVANAIRNAFSAAWSFVTRVVRANVQAIRGVISNVTDTVRNVGNAARTIFSNAWSAVTRTIRGYVSSIRDAIANITDTARNVAAAVRSAFSSAFGAVRSVGVGAFSAIRSAISPIVGAINSVIGAVRSLIGWLSRIKVPHISLPKIPGLGRSAAASATTAPLGVAGRSATASIAPSVGFGGNTRAITSSGGSVVINVTGALDPEAVARQIRRVLSGHERRIGVSAT